LVFAGQPLTAESAVLSENKIFVIEARVCQGDPRGGKGKIKVLSHPILAVHEGKPGTLRSGGIFPGLDSEQEEFVGLTLRICATRQVGGVIRLEVGVKIGEVVSQSKNGYETRSWTTRQEREMRDGETVKLRIKGSSATDQT